MISKLFEELKNTGELPSPTGVGMRILCLTQTDDWEVDDLAMVIQADQALTGRLIKLANSASSNGTETVTTVGEASLRLGAKQLSNIALGFTLIAGHREGACERFDYDEYWSDSLARGVAASELTKAIGKFEPAQAFTCGLLSRLGELALASVHPSDYSDLLDDLSKGDADGGGCDESVLESERFNINRHEVAVAMLEDWGMPTCFSESVGMYAKNEPVEATSSEETKELVRILQLAEVIAKFCRSDSREQVKRWSQMAEVQVRMGMDAAEFEAFCLKVGNEWQDWGGMLTIPTRKASPLNQVRQVADRVAQQQRKLLPNGPELIRDNDENKLRIIAVDDEPTSLLLLERHLVKAGHEVITARDGREALALALEYNPHIVVSDWMMPDMDGLELCRALRRFRSGRGMYFLLLTAQGEDDRIVEGFEAGIDDYIVKPFKPRILSARVRAGLRVVKLQEQVERDKKAQNEQVAKLAVMARKLRAAALTDPLTNLPNRRYAMQRLEEDWALWNRESQPMSVVMMDIDFFKRVNDEFGHDAGDEVLRQTAEVMRNACRKGDICARIGGEEFLVICTKTPLAGAVQCAERLRAAVEAHVVKFESFDGNITLSIGVSEAAAGMSSLDELLKAADEATYVAKQNGRNQVQVWGRTGDSTGGMSKSA